MPEQNKNTRQYRKHPFLWLSVSAYYAKHLKLDETNSYVTLNKGKWMSGNIESSKFINFTIHNAVINPNSAVTIHKSMIIDGTIDCTEDTSIDIVQSNIFSSNIDCNKTDEFLIKVSKIVNSTIETKKATNINLDDSHTKDIFIKRALIENCTIANSTLKLVKIINCVVRGCLLENCSVSSSTISNSVVVSSKIYRDRIQNSVLKNSTADYFYIWGSKITNSTLSSFSGKNLTASNVSVGMHSTLINCTYKNSKLWFVKYINGLADNCEASDIKWLSGTWKNGLWVSGLWIDGVWNSGSIVIHHKSAEKDLKAFVIWLHLATDPGELPSFSVESNCDPELLRKKLTKKGLEVLNNHDKIIIKTKEEENIQETINIVSNVSRSCKRE